MTRKTYGMIAGAAAAGVGMWWWLTRTSSGSTSLDRPEVIFDNTPRASTPDGNI
jgi:hypothetical protein